MCIMNFFVELFCSEKDLAIKYNVLTCLKIREGNLLQNNNRETQQKATNLTCKSLNGVQNGVLYKIRWFTSLFKKDIYILQKKYVIFYVCIHIFLM